MSDMDRTTALDRAEKKLRSANGTKRSFKMECRLVGDPGQRQAYEGRLSAHEQTLSSLGTDLKGLKAEKQRNQLFIGAKDDANGDIDPEATGDHLLNEASTIQDKTQQSIENTRNMVAASKEVGTSTLEELERQRRQIEDIDNEAMRIEDNLTRADKLIKTFGKRMATDKFIQCFACLNVMLLVGVILYSIFGKGSGLPGAKDNGSPTSPTNDRMLAHLFLRGSWDGDTVSDSSAELLGGIGA